MNYLDQLSKERKELQDKDFLPTWYTTAGWQLFKEKYMWAETPRAQYEHIARTLAKHTDDEEKWYDKFFQLMWRGWLSPSTPVLANTGTGRGLPVSCSGNYVGDSIDSFYASRRETALLTKYGFGTSAYLGDIRSRGSSISSGGKASGVLPVLKGFVQDSRDVSQGNCYHPEVEVLTEKGFLPFFEAAELDLKVAQVNTEGTISFVKPIEWVSQDFDGELYRFYDSKNIDISVTPNHRMYIRRRASAGVSNSFDVKEAKVCPLHRDVYMANSAIASGHHELSALERIAIAYQADGSPVWYRSKNSTGVCAARFRFKKDRKINRLRDLLQEAGLDYTEAFYPKDGTTNFYVKHVFKDKTLSWLNIEGMSASKGRAILLEVAQWDGSHVKTDSKERISFSYSTIDKINTDTLQAIASLSGFKSRVTEVPRDGNRQLQYKMHFSEGDLFGCENLKKEVIKYTGKVYCAVVPYGGLVVRSNGHTLVCGNTRRGSWAGYLPIDHGDFDEVVGFLEKEPDDVNIGWNISDDFVAKLSEGDADARRRFSRALKAKMVTGKGYFWFPDKANRKLPAYYPIKHYAAQLCNEVLLPSDEEHTYTCVLSSMNVALYDEWVNTDAIFTATVFLDCVASEFIERARDIPGLEKAVRFTEKARALGLGVAGFHTYIQSKGWSFGSLDTVYFNQQLFEKLDKESLDASIWMGAYWGYPEWAKRNDGTVSVRNCSRLAVAPTKSTALIMGGISEGINPDPAYVYTQTTAGGEVQRVAPELLKVMKERKVYNKETLQSITDAFGSVQHVDWLDDEEKLVFRTAFEIDQHVLVRLASQRAKFLDQWQSVNLFFSAKEEPKYIAEVHKAAFEDENILGLYYIYSQAGIAGSKDREEVCESCSG